MGSFSPEKFIHKVHLRERRCMEFQYR